MLASETDKHWNKGYISGTFDMFHIGHLNLIRRAKERCDYLVVGVLSDEVVMRIKHKKPVVPLESRLEIIKAVRYVDEVDITTNPLLKKVNAWDKYKFDAMFSGDDHVNDGWAREEAALADLGADLVFFPYTKEVTTTVLHEKTQPPRPPRADGADSARLVDNFRRIFPFDKVNKGERIVLYGTGRVGSQYATQLEALDYCEIAAFADTNAEKGKIFAGKRCFTPEELINNQDEYDRIVVSTILYKDAVLNLLRSLGIPPERIV